MRGNNKIKSEELNGDKILNKDIITYGNSQEVAELTQKISKKTERLSKNPYIGMTKGDLENERNILRRIIEAGDMRSEEYYYKSELINFAYTYEKSL